jgi:hypothetical protein
VADRQNGSTDAQVGSVAKASGSRSLGQRAAFIATARQYGASGSAKDFEKAFMKMVRPKRTVASVAQRRRRVPVGSGGEAARHA